MVQYYETFGVMLVVITLAFILKLCFFRIDIRKNSPLLMKVLFNLALPCIIFRNLYNNKTLDLDSLYLFIGGIIFQLCGGIISIFVFWFVKDKTIKKLSIFNSFALNTALFIFPVMSSVADDGISKTILFCVANDFCCYAVLRPLYAILGISQNKGNDAFETDEKKKNLISTQEEPMTEIKIDLPQLPELTNETQQYKIIELNDNKVITTAENQSDHYSFLKKIFNEETQKILKETLRAIFTCIPLYALVLGYICGLSHIKVPHFIIACIDVGANANTLLSYTVLGIFFEWHIPLKYLWPSVRVVLYRTIYGLIYGLTIYFSCKPFIGDVARFVMLVSPLTPPPLIDTIYSVEYKVNPVDIPILINNLSIIVSYVVILLLMVILNPSFN
ncbi:hypothetical protein ENUP19_0278G0032 [Entamoeba nuttalli]